MAQFMGQNPHDFLRVHDTEKPLCHGHNRVVRIPAGGKSIGCVIGDNIDFRHGQVCLLGKFFHHAVQLGHLLWRGFNGPVHFQYHFIRIPVTEKIHAPSENQGDDHALSSPQNIPGQNDKNGHQAQQKGGPDLVAHL